MNAFIKPIALIAAGAAIMLSTVTLADDSEDIQRIAKAQITLVEAIEIAQNHQGGQAYQAELDDDSFEAEYEIDVVAEGRRYEVTVDGVNGEVLKVREKHDD